MKDVTLAICNNNVVEWIFKMEMQRTNIELNISGAYNDDQLLMGVYAGDLLAKCKTFKNETQSNKQKRLPGTIPTQYALILPTR